jgi:hypothetical protein
LVFIPAAIGLGLIAYATLSTMTARPFLVSADESNLITIIERFGAYAVLGGLFYFAVPGRVGLPVGLVSAVAILLELLQRFRADRDPGFIDVIEKISGGVIGIVVLHAVFRMLAMSRRAANDANLPPP